MNLWLAYNIALGVGLVIVGAWAYNAHRHVEKGYRGSYEDPPTEEIPCPATMRIGPRLEEFGPGKPVPFVDENRIAKRGYWP